jgi:hypothetical protein
VSTSQNEHTKPAKPQRAAGQATIQRHRPTVAALEAAHTGAPVRPVRTRAAGGYRDLRHLRRGLHRPGDALSLPARRRGRRVLAWVHAHGPSLAVCAALLVVVAVVMGTGIGRYPSFSDDEGTYVAQAWAVLAHGSLAHYTYWYDHPPLGWIQLALASWVLGPVLPPGSAVEAGRTLMLIPALVSAGLVFVLARRLGMRRSFAAGAVLLFALSPLAVSSLRMVFLDNLATPWILGAFVLAASPKRRLWAYAGSGACFAIAVLTKETSLTILPGLIVAVLQGVDRRTRAFCVAAFAVVLALVAMAYPLLALLKGELLPGPGHVSLFEAVTFQLFGRASTGSALAPGSLSHQLAASWFTTDPWLLGAGLVALPVGLKIRRLRPPAVALLALVVMAIRPGYLPQPYVIALLPFCAVVAMGSLDAAWSWLGADRVRRFAFVAAAILGLGAIIGPQWLAADSLAMSSDPTRPALDAQHWVIRHVDHRARVLVDDTFYVDLVRAGFAPRFGAVWFYKLDFTTNLDPMIVRHLPQGWRAFDYVISTEVIRSALANNPQSLAQVRLALGHSTVVATFGSGAGRVEVRRITGVGTGSGLIPPAQATTAPRRIAAKPTIAPATKPAIAPAAKPAIAPSAVSRRSQSPALPAHAGRKRHRHHRHGR